MGLPPFSRFSLRQATPPVGWRGAFTLALLFLAVGIGCGSKEAPSPTHAIGNAGLAAPPQAGGTTAGLPPVIVLDPGHGGEDTGAKFNDDYLESHIVLAVAKRTREALKRIVPQLPVAMTRETDVYVPLKERMDFANRLEAGLFVSIHVNAAARRGARGIETYLLSAEASDDDARRVALIENSVLEREGGDPEDPLLLTLLSLASAEQIRYSEELAGIVHTELTSSLETENRGVRQAPFFVLSRARMPSVLVEIGFLSNPAERVRLQDERHQGVIASSLARAIVKFMQSHGQLTPTRIAKPLAP